MKALIINYNRLTLCRNLADWCAEHGLDPVIVDNGSTYEPLLDYYRTTPHPVIRFHFNYGSHVVWDKGVVDMLGIEGQYIVTDSDLDLSGVPDDFLDIMTKGLEKHQWAVKCGLSLEINDLPDTAQGHYIRNNWEKVYWREPLDGMYFKADTATTFALYRVEVKEWKVTPAIRTNRPYTAKHVPWYYTDFDGLPEDEKNYFNTTNPKWSTGKHRVLKL